jgi:hypothetical protein
MKGDGEYEYVVGVCEFAIERTIKGDKWDLFYRLPINHPRAGNYRYAVCDTPEQCCAILALSDPADKRWLELKDRVPELVLPPEVGTLSKWRQGVLPD